MKLHETERQAKKLGDIIVDFISKRKIASLERAFKANKTLMDNIKKYNDAFEAHRLAHEHLMKTLKNVCAKNDCEFPPLTK